jgi:protein involved in polysaccharide export with SLBB domain
MKPHLALAALVAVLGLLVPTAGAQAPADPAAKFDVTIQGQVVKPGHYSVSSDLTVIDAIELAGGFTERALRSGVRITHSGKEAGGAPATTLDYSDFSLNNNNAKFRLEPGDIILIPADPTYGK